MGQALKLLNMEANTKQTEPSGGYAGPVGRQLSPVAGR